MNSAVLVQVDWEELGKRLDRGVKLFAIGLRPGVALTEIDLNAIRGAWAAIQNHQRKGPRAKLVIVNASAEQYEQLRAARITNVIPVERRDAPLKLTSEPGV